MRCDLFAPPRREDRHSTISAAVDRRFIVRCLALFRAGFDTFEIAQCLFERECAVATAVRIGREAERMAM